MGGCQGAGWAGLHTFAAADAGARTHGVIEIENNLRLRTAQGIADHIVDLYFAAGSHATCALNTSLEVDGHGRM